MKWHAAGYGWWILRAENPLLRTDYEEIVKALSRYGIDIGTIYTNASLLTADVLEMMKSYGQKPSFQLSFDGLGHHDWLRGVQGRSSRRMQPSDC